MRYCNQPYGWNDVPTSYKWGRICESKSAVSKPQPKYSCDKKNCGEMSSCEEAKYKLETCGHKRLDRDKNGVPCETICPGG
jgi:hypothetical protein